MDIGNDSHFPGDGHFYVYPLLIVLYIAGLEIKFISREPKCIFKSYLKVLRIATSTSLGSPQQFVGAAGEFKGAMGSWHPLISTFFVAYDFTVFLVFWMMHSIRTLTSIILIIIKKCFIINQNEIEYVSIVLWMTHSMRS